MAEIKTVGVIGAGQMGAGIAHVCALAGYEVRFNDVAPERIAAGLELISTNLSRQVARGTITLEAMQAALPRIKATEAVADVASTDLVIEAATENEEVKKSIFRSLAGHLGPETLLASNTSSISITRLASVTDRPEKFIGLHFMNPVPLMKLVEIVRGLPTSQSTVDTVMELAKRFGKTTIGARDIPGFIVNRMLLPLLNEACYGLYEGLGTAADIDTGVRLGLNHPMGPLELADLIGLDTCLAIAEVLHRELGDDKYRPCPLLRQYVAAGWLGKKVARGFYEYDSQGQKKI